MNYYDNLMALADAGEEELQNIPDIAQLQPNVYMTFP